MAPYKRVFAWVLQDAQRYAQPLPLHARAQHDYMGESAGQLLVTAEPHRSIATPAALFFCIEAIPL